MVAQPANLYPFDPAVVSTSVDLSNSTYCRIANWDRSYGLVLRYVAKHLCTKGDHRNFDMAACHEHDSSELEEVKDVVLEAGIGLHKFTWRNHTLHCLHQYLHGKQLQEGLVLYAPKENSEDVLTTFVDELVKQSMATGQNKLAVYQWQAGCASNWDDLDRRK